MQNWSFPSLLLLCVWTSCNRQYASATVRVVRAFQNSSKFIHHALKEDDSATTGPTDALDCMNQTLISTEDVIITDAVSRRRRQEIAAETTTLDYSDEFINCDEGHSNVEEGCYIRFPNGSVFVPVYKRLFKTTDYSSGENGDILVCPAFFDDHEDSDDDAKFSATLAIVTVAGTAVSALCILVHMGMFVALEKLRNLPGYSLFSMCVALLVAYACTFIPYARRAPSDCTALGVIKAYSFLASFFWMNVMSYDIWRSLRLATAKLRLTGQRPMMTRFALYSAYSWGCPLLVIVLGFIVNSTESSEVKYRLIISDDTCWFKHKPALQVYFAFPLFALLVVNVLLFVSSFVMINSATMNTAENRADLWPTFLVSVRLAVVMGLMWVFGVLAAATEAEWLWYFYVFCNVLQGAFIFFSFTLTKKTRKECQKAIARKKSSVFPTTMTSQHSSSV